MQVKKELYRGVIWPREIINDTQGKPVYRYVLVGMLITDEPILGLDSNETVIDGVVNLFEGEGGMAHMLSKAGKFMPSQPLGDATSVLLSLDDIVGDPLMLHGDV